MIWGYVLVGSICLTLGAAVGFVLAALCNVAGNGIDYEAIEWERMEDGDG